MKRVLVILLVVAGLFVVGGAACYWVFLAPRVRAEYESPDGRYRLVVYEVPILVAAPGQGSDQMAIVELRDRRGRVLARLSDKEDEAVMVRDVLGCQVEWGKNEVWFAKVRMFKFP